MSGNGLNHNATVRRALVTIALWAVHSSAAEEPGPPERIFLAMTSERQSPESVILKMIVFNLGQRFESDGAARIRFAADDPMGEAFESAAPGPRTVTVPVRCKTWARDHVEVVRFGPFAFGKQTPKRLHVIGALVGSPPMRLGTLIRGDGEDAPLAFQRFCPCPPTGKDQDRILVAAASERLDSRRFLLKIAYLNCGQRFDADYSAFVHFELDSKGENLGRTAALNMPTYSQKMDTSAWGEDELTVVTFGPFDVPHEAPGHVYVRAGVYDQFGTGRRLNLMGSDDGAGRVLVGRFVSADGAVEFERLPLPSAVKAEQTGGGKH